MDLFSSHPQCTEAVAAFFLSAGSKLSGAQQAALAAAVSHASPVYSMKAVTELLYANQAEITDAPTQAAARTLAAQCAAWAAAPSNGFMDSGRGAGIYNAMARDLGEAAPLDGWPDPSTDPTPDAEWVIS